MHQAFFRFYEELNSYLPEGRRKVWFAYCFSDAVSLGDALRSMAVPPDEIDLILVNQQSQGLDYMLQDSDRISVYPVFELFDLTGVSQIREKPLRDPRFICDVHLGRLCKYLRMFGWDTCYDDRYTPENMIAISIHEKRILLSRSYRLTRHKELTHAFWIRSSDSSEQLKDLVNKLDLTNLAKAFTRCLRCNHLLVPVEKQEILHRLQARTATDYHEFFLCPSCDKIYWKGSHVERMVDFMQHSIQVADSLPGGAGEH